MSFLAFGLLKTIRTSFEPPFMLSAASCHFLCIASAAALGLFVGKGLIKALLLIALFLKATGTLVIAVRLFGGGVIRVTDLLFFLPQLSVVG